MPKQSFEEFHKAECPRLHSMDFRRGPGLMEAISVISSSRIHLCDGDVRWGSIIKKAKFIGKTCREVYDALPKKRRKP